MRAESLKRVKKGFWSMWSKNPLAILVDQKTTSVPPKNNNGGPQKSKKGSQASVSPCCAKMYQHRFSSDHRS